MCISQLVLLHFVSEKAGCTSCSSWHFHSSPGSQLQSFVVSACLIIREFWWKWNVKTIVTFIYTTTIHALSDQIEKTSCSWTIQLLVAKNFLHHSLRVHYFWALHVSLLFVEHMMVNCTDFFTQNQNQTDYLNVPFRLLSQYQTVVKLKPK